MDNDVQCRWSIFTLITEESSILPSHYYLDQAHSFCHQQSFVEACR